MFKTIDTPKCLYIGHVGPQFESLVHSGQIKRMTFEGVVCKAMQKRKYYLFKNKAWIEKLKQRCAGDEKLFNELL